MTDTILVIPDFAPDGAPAASAAELLGAAALVGTPVAVVPANADPAALASLGATQVFQGSTWATPADAAATGLEHDEQGVLAYHAAFGGTFTSVSAPTFGAPRITLQPRRQRPPSAGCRAKRRRARWPRASRTPVYHPAPDGSQIDRPPRPRRRLPRRRRRLHRPHRPDRTDRRDRDPRPLYRARYLGRGPTPRRHADLQAHHRCEHRP